MGRTMLCLKLLYGDINECISPQCCQWCSTLTYTMLRDRGFVVSVLRMAQIVVPALLSLP